MRTSLLMTLVCLLVCGCAEVSVTKHDFPTREDVAISIARQAVVGDGFSEVIANECTGTNTYLGTLYTNKGGREYYFAMKNDSDKRDTSIVLSRGGGHWVSRSEGHPLPVRQENGEITVQKDMSVLVDLHTLNMALVQNDESARSSLIQPIKKYALQYFEGKAQKAIILPFNERSASTLALLLGRQEEIVFIGLPPSGSPLSEFANLHIEPRDSIMFNEADSDYSGEWRRDLVSVIKKYGKELSLE